jgi:hypothetical protein
MTGVPTAYVNLDIARQKHPGRADKYVELLWHADPLADAVVEAFASMPEPEWRRMRWSRRSCRRPMTTLGASAWYG